MDNDIVWRGSSSGARTFSHIVRLCLAVGIEMIFTPTYTPEANPIIESFNGVWASNFWHRRIFADLDHVRQELPHFQTYYRHRHPLAEFEERKAVELAPNFRPFPLSEDFDQHRWERIPLTAGLIHFIRFVDAKATFYILNERWTLPDNLANKTIRATIDTNNQLLLIYHQDSLCPACAKVGSYMELPCWRSCSAAGPGPCQTKRTVLACSFSLYRLLKFVSSPEIVLF